MSAPRLQPSNGVVTPPQPTPPGVEVRRVALPGGGPRQSKILSADNFDDYWRFHESAEHRRNHLARYSKATLPVLSPPRRARHIKVVKQWQPSSSQRSRTQINRRSYLLCSNHGTAYTDRWRRPSNSLPVPVQQNVSGSVIGRAT